jgi:hypothetical protein
MFVLLLRWTERSDQGFFFLCVCGGSKVAITGSAQSACGRYTPWRKGETFFSFSPPARKRLLFTERRFEKKFSSASDTQCLDYLRNEKKLKRLSSPATVQCFFASKVCRSQTLDIFLIAGVIFSDIVSSFQWVISDAGVSSAWNICGDFQRRSRGDIKSIK